MPDLPNIHALIVLALTVFTLFLFTRDSIPLETSSLLILILLVVIFQLFPYELDGAGLKATDFFAGFGHEALITIAACITASIAAFGSITRSITRSVTRSVTRAIAGSGA